MDTHLLAPDASGIGVRVLEQRHARGWSRRELVRRSGLCEQELYKLEHGSRRRVESLPCPESSPSRPLLKPSLPPSSASCPGRAGPRGAWRWGALGTREELSTGGRAAGGRRQKAV